MNSNVTMLSQEVKHTFADVGIDFFAMETMGDRIRHLRLAKGWTQDQLGHRLDVSRAAVSQWERGESENIKIATYLQLCEELGTTPDYLVFGPDGPARGPDGRYRYRRNG